MHMVNRTPNGTNLSLPHIEGMETPRLVSIKNGTWLPLLRRLFVVAAMIGVTARSGQAQSCSSPDITIPLNSAPTLLTLGIVSGNTNPNSAPSELNTINSASIAAPGASVVAIQQPSTSAEPGAAEGNVRLSIDVSGLAAGCYGGTFTFSLTTFITSTGVMDTSSASGPVSWAVVSGTQVLLIDPNPGLVNGSAVLNSSQLQAQLTAGSSAISGVAADGVTQAVIRIQTISAGHRFTLTLLNDQNVQSSSSDADGALGNPGDTTFSQSLVTLNAGTALDSNGLAYAFAVYRAPIDFARSGGDNQLTSRSVSVLVQDTTNGTVTLNTLRITILRPPVVLIHGLWSHPGEAWDKFTPLTGDKRFSFGRVSFDSPVSLSGSTPAYPAGLSNVRANSLGMQYNAPRVLTQLKNWIDKFRSGQNAARIPVAAVQADIVAHSMGGVLARTLPLLPEFISTTYGQGLIHKLITIDTPHLGTPLAAQLLGSTSDCTRKLLTSNEDFSFRVALVNGGTVAPGAVGDLQGNGVAVDSSLSPALNAIAQPGPHALPTALIAGVYTNFASLDCMGCVANYIYHRCGDGGDLLAQQLTGFAWPLIFGSPGSNANDAVVPQTSQLNGLSGFVYSGLVHSPGIEALSFTGPSVLDPSTAPNPIPNQIITLLNTPYTQSVFQRLNP